MHGKNPLIPMAAITGRPGRARMREVLSSYKSVGVEQFLIYPRTGLEFEYMSPEWMRLVRDTVEIAAELDMHIWLYDEYNFPSGNCRGQVTQGHPEFYPNALVFNRTKEGIVSRVVRNRVGADILNPEAVSRFISLTHQRYYDELKEYFGSVIQGIFTDEPSFAYYAWNGDHTLAEEVSEDSFLLPWYDGLEADYRAQCGRDLREDVIRWMEGAPSGFLWKCYHRIMGERMRTVYISQIEAWCHAHGILFTGHLMAETAYQSVTFNGNPLKMLRTFSLPGMDEIFAQTALNSRRIDFSAMSLVQYAGHGKAGQLAELFAVAPSDTPLTILRQMIWLVSCFGVDHYLMAVAALDPKGNIGKPGYYFPSSQTQPWFPFYKDLTETALAASHTARLSYEPEVRLRFPSDFFMRILHTEAHEQLGTRFLRLLEGLTVHQIQYLYLDEDEETTLPVICMDENGFYLEGCKRHFDETEVFLNWLDTRFPRRCTVREENGSETRDVLMRRWADGTVTLVDLTEDERTERLLTVTLDGCEGQVLLPGRGVFCGKLTDMRQRMPTILGPAEISNLRLHLEQDNLLRCLYTMKKPDVTLEAEEKLESVILLLRREPDPVSAALDGVPLEAEEEASRLPDGFRDLYRATRPFTLEAGIHNLTIANGEVKYGYRRSSQTSGVYVCDHFAPGAVDYRYLPSIWLAGDFRCERNGVITPSRNEEVPCEPLRGIPDYAGSFSLTGTIRIPEEPGLSLMLDTNFACTEVWLDGRMLGTRCWAPYIWAIPREYRGGEHLLRVRITTSVAPLFGDITPFQEEQPYWSTNLPCRFGKVGLMKTPEWVSSPE